MGILSTGEFYAPEVGCWIPTSILACDLCERRVDCSDGDEHSLLLAGEWEAVRLRNEDGELVVEYHCECRAG